MLILDFLVVDPEKLPARVNMKLFNRLQMEFAANIFTPEVYDGRKLEQKDQTLHPAVYDGRKNAFTTYQLPLGPNDSQQVFTFILYQLTMINYHISLVRGHNET